MKLFSEPSAAKPGSYKFFKTVDVPFQQLINDVADILALFPGKTLKLALELGIQVYRQAQFRSFAVKLSSYPF
jgi:hypothetical protein